MENLNDIKKITIYTDGACSGNPGKGGWGAILIYKNHKKTISGMEQLTTNNKMELKAVIESLKILKEKCIIDLFTDSKYVADGITEWLPKWIEKNWKTATKGKGKPIKNQDLWQELNILLQQHKVNIHWVKGHAENELNNEVDKIARNAII